MIGAIVVYLVLVLGSAWWVVSGVATVRAGFDRHEERTVITDRPLSSIDAIAFGKIALMGTARPDGHVDRLPFGGEERALAYEVTVDDTNKLELPHVDERTAPPFVLETDADDCRVRVDASALRWDLSDDRRWGREVASHEELAPDLASYAAARDLPPQGMERDREFAYEYVAPGDEVFVYGRAVPDESRRSDAEKAVLVTDDDGSGVLSDKSSETLLAERRRALLRHVSIGATKAVVGLVVFLYLTGIRLLLG